jgi:hypothetical protein
LVFIPEVKKADESQAQVSQSIQKDKQHIDQGKE